MSILAIGMIFTFSGLTLGVVFGLAGIFASKKDPLLLVLPHDLMMLSFGIMIVGIILSLLHLMFGA